MGREIPLATWDRGETRPHRRQGDQPENPQPAAWASREVTGDKNIVFPF